MVLVIILLASSTSEFFRLNKLTGWIFLKTHPPWCHNFFAWHYCQRNDSFFSCCWHMIAGGHRLKIDLHMCISSTRSMFWKPLAWKVSKYGVFAGPYFSVFGLNTGKYGPEKNSQGYDQKSKLLRTNSFALAHWSVKKFSIE